MPTDAMRKRLLIVSKRPVYDLLRGVDRRRLADAGVIDVDRLREGREAHQETLDAVCRQLGDHRVTLVHLDEIGPNHVRKRDLVIAVGGDGTALSAHHLLKGETPLLTVNSDPHRSIGHYARCTATTFAAVFDAWLAGRHHEERLARLSLHHNGRQRAILNDCLICNANPGTMSRYRLATPDGDEVQGSSGIWVSTASGSSGAIASAGMTPVPPQHPALLFVIREPFQGRGPIRLARGIQQPPDFLAVTAGLAGLAAYIDGQPAHIPINPGSSMRITACDEDLRLIAPPLN